MPTKILNVSCLDFASLYPSVMKSFNDSSLRKLGYETYDSIYLDFLRKRNRQKLMEERRKKLEKLNELYEE